MLNWESQLQKWLQASHLDAELRKQLIEMESDREALKDAFYESLPFHSGGMCGIIGPGINRMNKYTIQKAVKGLARYIEENCVNYKDRGVVIAYDSRYMSKAFALDVAKVLGVHHIKSYVFESPKPTPLLSFAVRYLGTVAGIMITASHYPSQYNGFKIYNEEGSKISNSEAKEISLFMNQVKNELEIEVVNTQQLVDHNLLQWMNGEVDHAYLEQLIKITKMDDQLLKEEKNLQIVFTPLHGTGLHLVTEGLKQINFKNIHIVEQQITLDPEFATVVSPNPSEQAAFAEAIKLGKVKNADVLLATDSDSGRLGIAVKSSEGEYVHLTGNQLGSLLLDYILMHTNKQVLINARLIKTFVTTELGRLIATSYGVKTIDTLLGFNYIGEKINEFDATGETFIFGFAENNGYLINSFSRDKDAIQAAVMTCEMAQYWKNKGLSLLDVLEQLYEKYRYNNEGLRSLTLDEVES